jgi:hypothetical protein
LLNSVVKVVQLDQMITVTSGMQQVYCRQSISTACYTALRVNYLIFQNTQPPLQTMLHTLQFANNRRRRRFNCPV